MTRAERLRSMLADLGIGIGEFSRTIEVDRGTVGRWLSGSRRVPMLAILYVERLVADAKRRR